MNFTDSKQRTIVDAQLPANICTEYRIAMIRLFLREALAWARLVLFWMRLRL